MTPTSSTDEQTTPAASPAAAESPKTRTLFFAPQECLFLFASLLLAADCFIPWRVDGKDASLFEWMTTSVTVPYFISLSFWVFVLTPFTTKLPEIRPWAGFFSVIGAFILSIYSDAAAVQSRVYGAEWARILSTIVLVLSANPAVIKIGDLAMQRMNSRATEVFTHWGTALAGMHFSAQQIYGSIENEIRNREWPGVEVLRFAYTEAGLLSHKREYLRIIRQRQVFDLCAGSFGKDYFITLRESEFKAPLTVVTLLILLFVCGMVLYYCVSALGSISGLITFGCLLIVGGLVLMNVLRMGLTRLDGILMRMPVLGPVYETFFRRSTTYFQHDSRVVFLKLMDDLVKAHVADETAAKGVTHLSCFEHQPILDGLYKMSTRPLRAPDSMPA